MCLTPTSAIREPGGHPIRLVFAPGAVDDRLSQSRGVMGHAGCDPAGDRRDSRTADVIVSLL